MSEEISELLSKNPMEIPEEEIQTWLTSVIAFYRSKRATFKAGGQVAPARAKKADAPAKPSIVSGLDDLLGL